MSWKALFENRAATLGVFLLLGILLKLVYLLASPIWRVDLFFYIQGAQTIVDGGTLFKDFGEIKPAGIFFLYAGILKLFGGSLIFFGIKLLAILFQTLTAWTLYLTGRNLSAAKTGFWMGAAALIALSVNFHFWPANVMLLGLLPLSISFFLILKNPFSSLFLFFSGCFLGIAFLINSNMIAYGIIYPLVIYFFLKNFSKTVLSSFLLGLGFLIPLTAVFFYFFAHHALTDWYWWNIQWAGIYGGAYPLWLRAWKLVYGILLTWQWAPLYGVAFYGFYRFLKNKKWKDNSMETAVVLLFLGAFLSRILLGKGEPRYYLYLLPALILILPYGWKNIRSEKVKFYYKILLLLPVAGFGFSVFQGFKASYTETFRQKKPIYQWIQENSRDNEKIFVWFEGYEYYLMTNRKMATSFFSTSQHLDYPYVWEQNHYQDIEIPWKKFQTEFKAERPVLVVDPTGSFSQFNEKERKEPLKSYMRDFVSYIETNYTKSFEFQGTVIWKKNP